MTATSWAAAAGEGDSVLTLLRAGGAEAPLFCVHAQAGHLRVFRNLVAHLDPAWPVYGLGAVAADGRPQAAYRSFEAMAEKYRREISEIQPTGPYRIVGECIGGQLAYELAQQLAARGEEVGLLALVDSFGPGGLHLGRFVPRRAYRAVDFARMLSFHLRTLARLDPPARWEYLSRRLGRISDAIRRKVFAGRDSTFTELAARQAFREALRAYRARPYSGRVVLFRGAKLPWGVKCGRDLGWGSVASDLQVTELPAYYGTSMLEPAVALLAEKLEQALLERVTRPRPVGVR